VPCFQHIAQDEVGLTRSVFHIKRSSLPVIFGIAVATGVSLHFDKQMSQALTGLPTNPKPLGREADIVGVYGPVGMGGILYLAGSVFHNSRVRETGLLATEAMADADLLGEGLKFVTNRQAPGSGPSSFSFYASGVQRGGSMPSTHALNAWSFARVIAGESHSRWIGVIAYSAATSVSFSRTLTGAHSVSDVIVGSALGYAVGDYVLRKRSTARRITIYHVASIRGVVTPVQRHEEAPQPVGLREIATLTNPKEALEQKDVTHSISSEQPTDTNKAPTESSPSDDLPLVSLEE
jgi:membrane-associated phospholipid phosphatase